MNAVDCRESEKQYAGPLNAAQIAAGMNAAQDNAARLLADSELLLGAERYPTAASVAILAIEEVRKISTLRRMAICTDDAERRLVWAEYRSGRGKNCHSIIPDIHGAADEQIAGEGSTTDRSGMIGALKQRGFYTDCMGDANWTAPETSIEKQLAEQFIGIARIALATSSYRHTAKEIELWAAHLGPVLDKPSEWIKTALRNWHRAMAQQGLVDLDPIVFEQLLRAAAQSRHAPA